MNNSKKRNTSLISRVNGRRKCKRFKSSTPLEPSAVDTECEVYDSRNIEIQQKASEWAQTVNHIGLTSETDYVNDPVNGCEELLNNGILLSDNSFVDNSMETLDGNCNVAEIDRSQEEFVYDTVLQNLKNQLCRVCGRKRTSLLPIFGTHFVNEVPISEKLQMYLPLEVNVDDNLPLNICMSCNTMVQAWHDLHVSCAAADIVLRRMLLETPSNIFIDCCPENLEESSDEKSISDQPQEKCFTPTPAEIDNEVGKISSKEGKNSKESFPPHSCKMKCCYCSEDVESSDLKHHKLQCQSQQTMCEFCGVCVQQRYLKHHVLNVHKETMLCETCGKFFSWHDLKSHSGECVRDPIRYCELCFRVFFSEQGYKIHMKEHARGVSLYLRMKIKASILDELSLIYYCPVCGDCFQDKLSVIVHLNSYKLMTCVPCRQDFRNERAYLVHVHKPNQKFWHCHYCFQTFRRKYSWQIHERTHCVQNRSFCCKMCGKQYPSLENLLQHALCHGSNSFYCTHCDKKFSRQSALKEHILYHEGYIYKCKTCSKQFQTTRSLRVHQIKVHRNKILPQKKKVKS